MTHVTRDVCSACLSSVVGGLHSSFPLEENYHVPTITHVTGDAYGAAFSPVVGRIRIGFPLEN